MENNRIFLIGLMGSGKTHWAQRLAKILGWKFVDLDKLIEEEEGLNIPEIFGQYGEHHFRNLEKKYLSKISAMNDVVVAAGGGTPCFNGNMDLMNKMGETYYLQVSVPTVVSRLEKKIEGRPLLQNKNSNELLSFLTKQLKEREQFYLKAKHVIDEEKLDEKKLKELFILESSYDR